MRKLYLIRHAKARKDILGIKDEERPLNKKGEKEAFYIGSYLKKNGIVLQAFYSSHAKRAWETAKIIAERVGFPEKKIRIIRAIYNSNKTNLLRIIKKFSDRFHSVAVFGHNPEFHTLVNHFSDYPIEKFPTCGVFEIEFKVDSWKKISKRNGKIKFFVFPKK